MNTSTPVLVFMWMTGALVSFVFAAIAIRTLTSHFNVFEIGVVRTAGGLAIIVGAAFVRPGLLGDILASDATIHAGRNVVHAVGGILWTMAIGLLPLATVFSLEFTAPAWVAILAYPMLGERISRRAMIGIGAGLVGVLIILRPAPGSVDLTALLPLGAAFCFAMSVLLTRRLALTETLVAILFWMMTLQFAFFGAGALVMGGGTAFGGPWPDGALFAMVGLACAGLGSQLCLSRALQIGEATMVVPLDFLRVPLIAMIGWLLYGEPLSVWIFLGAACILAGITYGLMPDRSAVLARARSAPAE
ncbi:MAG: DMT family transporter [Burkholderiales bacterium]|nr:DMT family transporter [Burkholderiales bacterium]